MGTATGVLYMAWKETAHLSMSPTVFRSGAYRFYFFSREEARIHIHVQHPRGEAKFWLSPRIELAENYGLNASQVRKARRLIEENEIEIQQAWQRLFGRGGYGDW